MGALSRRASAKASRTTGRNSRALLRHQADGTEGRPVSRGMSRTSAASFAEYEVGSQKLMGRMPDSPASSFRQHVSRSGPREVLQPSPVINTLRAIIGSLSNGQL